MQPIAIGSTAIRVQYTKLLSKSYPKSELGVVPEKDVKEIVETSVQSMTKSPYPYVCIGKEAKPSSTILAHFAHTDLAPYSLFAQRCVQYGVRYTEHKNWRATTLCCSNRDL
jgi:hypothetical protein